MLYFLSFSSYFSALPFGYSNSVLWFFLCLTLLLFAFKTLCLNAFYYFPIICLCIWLNCVVSGWFCTRPFGFLMLPKGERTGLEIKKSILLSFFHTYKIKHNFQKKRRVWDEWTFYQTCIYYLDFRVVIIKKGEIVEARLQEILMMPTVKCSSWIIQDLQAIQEIQVRFESTKVWLRGFSFKTFYFKDFTLVIDYHRL